MAQINQYNFLRWFDTEIDTAQPDLPRPYERDTEACPYMPVAYPTEACSFFINQPAGFTLVGLLINNTSELRLDLVNVVTGASVNNVAPLQVHWLDDTHFTLYATAVFPAVNFGQYYFRIVRTTDNAMVCYSNNLLVRLDKAQLDRETVYVRFRHDRWFYHTQYQLIPGFYQQFRIHLNLLEDQYESDQESYRAVTTGKNRVFQAYLNKFRKVEAYWLDREALEALAVMLEHSYLELNGKVYIKKAQLKVSDILQSKYKKADFELWDDEFASVNRC